MSNGWICVECGTCATPYEDSLRPLDEIICERCQGTADEPEEEIDE